MVLWYRSEEFDLTAVAMNERSDIRYHCLVNLVYEGESLGGIQAA